MYFLKEKGSVEIRNRERKQNQSLSVKTSKDPFLGHELLGHENQNSHSMTEMVWKSLISVWYYFVHGKWPGISQTRHHLSQSIQCSS